MSISQYVIFEGAKLPTITQWEEVANEFGFKVEIEDVQLHEHSGYLPVQFMGKKSGFEFYLHNSSEFDQFEFDQSRYGSVIEFVTFSDMVETQCALVCALALLEATSGLYFDSEGGQCDDSKVLADQAKEWIDS